MGGLRPERKNLESESRYISRHRTDFPSYRDQHARSATLTGSLGHRWVPNCSLIRADIASMTPENGLGVLWSESFQSASQCLSDSNHSAKEHVNFSCLNALNIPNVQVGEFGKLLLSHAACHSLAPNAVAQLFEPRRQGFSFCHLLFVRKTEVDRHGVCAVFLASTTKKKQRGETPN